MNDRDDLVITAHGLTRTFRRVVAVSDLSLGVRRGEIFGLLGPDGAGKTTTIQMLTGLLRPTAGTLQVAGVDVVRDPGPLAQKIGYMSEGFTLYGSLTVNENLEFFADLHAVPSHVRRQRMEELLHFSRLADVLRRPAQHLSGGMQKKLALACTLIHEPEILFLDEPTTGVDPVSRRDFWRILHRFLGGGMTIVASTPYMDEAERFHRVALMHRGTLVAVDTPAALRAELGGRVIEFTARPQRAAAEAVRPLVRSVQAFGDRLHVLVDDGERALDGLRQRLQSAGIQVDAIASAAPSLEDVFVQAIGERAPAPPIEGASAGVRRPGTPDESVVVEGLSKQFDHFAAVQGVSFAARRGEVFGLLGPNGSGKTTTIRVLTGLLPPSGGRAIVAGFDVRTQPQLLRPVIGYMSQRFSLYRDMTVEENLDFYAGVYGLSGAAAGGRKAWVLEMAGLTGQEHALTRDLSGGWRQRLALGCAILHHPQVLFLDEPTSGVDPVSRRAFWELINSLAADGTTVLVTTHYMDEAEHCQTIGLMYGGRLIALGSPPDLRRMLAGEMLEIAPRDPLAALNLLRQHPWTWQATLFGDKVHVFVERAADGAAWIEQVLHGGGLEVGRIAQVSPTLEDAFVGLIEAEDRRRVA